MYNLLKYKHVYNIRAFSPLDYINYNKETAKAALTKKLRWEDYGGKHHESVFTRFYQGYVLPKKFNIDKRKAHLSSLINAGQITRDKALKELETPTYPTEMQKQDYDFVIKKLNFSREKFEQIMREAPKSHFSYPTDIWSKINRKYLYPNSKLRAVLTYLYYKNK
jgi:hypothetical protein